MFNSNCFTGMAHTAQSDEINLSQEITIKQEQAEEFHSDYKYDVPKEETIEGDFVKKEMVSYSDLVKEEDDCTIPELYQECEVKEEDGDIMVSSVKEEEQCTLTEESLTLFSPPPSSQHSGNDKQYSCEFCSFSSSWVRSWKRHLKTRHNSIPVKPIKKRSIITQQNTNDETAKNKKSHLRCDICFFDFKNTQTLLNHITTVHLNLGSNNYTCSFCPFSSPWKSNLKRHLIHTKCLSYYNKCLKTPDKKRCRPSKTLLEHLATIKKAEEQVFECDKCDYKSGKAEHLKIHGMQHLGKQQLIRCVHCSFSTREPKKLRRHEIKTHPEPVKLFPF